MSKPFAATAIVKRPDGRILMQLRDDGRGAVIPYPNMWNFPGGAVEQDEQPLEAAIREIAEEFEITLDADVCRKIWSYTHAHATIDYIFLCLVSPDTEPVLHEGAACEWMTLAEIAALKLGFDQEKVVEYLKENLCVGG
jgi:8-oxo-dGTP diphosphatase